MSVKNCLLVLIGCLLQEARSRHVSLSLNLSLPEDHKMFTSDVLQHCMRETEMSMAELNRFRESLITNDDEILMTSMEEGGNGFNGEADTGDDGRRGRDVGDTDAVDLINNQYSSIPDYDSISQLSFNERNEESLQCFAHCLYEQMGLVKNDIFKEQELFRKLFTLIIEREKKPIRECEQLESGKKCERAYKMHLCYMKLKTMDAERRIREILEREDTKNVELENTELEKAALTDDDMDDVGHIDPKKNEIDRD